MEKDEPKMLGNIPSIESYLKRIALFLEDGNWRGADLYCEKILDIDPENAEAYLGKLLAELKLKNREALSTCVKTYEDSKNCQKVFRFCDDILKAELTGYLEQSQNYRKQIAKQNSKRNKKIAIVVAAIVFIAIAVVVYITTIKPAVDYNHAVWLMNDAASSKNVLECQDAIAVFDSLDGYKDSNEKISVCKYNCAVFYMAEHNSTHNAEIFFKALRNDAYLYWETVAAGGYHTVAVKNDGTVVATGRNYEGQCNVSNWTNIVTVSAGWEHTVGLRSDGTVVATEFTGKQESYRNQCDVSGWTDIVAISAGTFHTVALKNDGTVLSTGWNEYGQCDVSDWRNIIAITAGDDYTIGLTKDGTVLIAGDRAFGQNTISDWTDIVTISKGGIHTAGLKDDGTVVADGWNEDGQCNVNGWTDIGVVSAGGYHTVGLVSDGTIVVVGNNDYGQCDVIGWTDIKLPTPRHNENQLFNECNARRNSVALYQNV